MKDYKYNYNAVRVNPMMINKSILQSKSPQINFSVASKNNSNLFNKIMNKNVVFEPSRQNIERSPVPNNYIANNYANNSKSPLKLLNYLYSKQQENSKKANSSNNANAKQFIQMKLQNDSVNAVYQINLKKNQHIRAQSMHRDIQATDEKREREINGSRDRINDKSPLRIIKNISDNKSYVLNRKSSIPEKKIEESHRKDIQKYEKLERSIIINNNNNNNPERIEFKINKNIDRSAIERQMKEFKKKTEEEKIKLLVQKQKEEQENDNNVEENIENHNKKNYDFEPFVNFTNFKSIQMKPKVKETDSNKLISNSMISKFFLIDIFCFNFRWFFKKI